MSFLVDFAVLTAAMLLVLFTPRSSSGQQSELAPLIDREVFFGNPEIVGVRPSPDGSTISFRMPFTSTHNEGHSFRGEENQLAMWAAAETFLAKHLRGRYQGDMSDETAPERGEITVDVSTVELPEPPDESASSEFPEPVRDLEVGSDTYTSTIRMNDQEMQLSVTRTIEESDGNWRVTETATGQMGEVTDSEVLAKGKLTPIERHTVQGPAEIKLTYTDEKIEGTFNMNGQQQPVSVELDGPIYSDGAGSALVVASLPLEEGYEARYGTFDLMSQQVRQMKLTVTGVEDVTVPAGTFEAYRVEVNPASGDPGGSTLWVSTDDYDVVKVETVVPQMGGAVVTSELEPASGGSE